MLVKLINISWHVIILEMIESLFQFWYLGPWYTKPVQLEIRKKVLACLRAELLLKVRLKIINEIIKIKNVKFFFI